MLSSKLISARVDSDTLQRIDLWCEQSRWYKRNQVINRLLKLGVKAIMDDNGPVRNTHINLYELSLQIENQNQK